MASWICVVWSAGSNWPSNSVMVMPFAAATSSMAALEAASQVLAELADM
mgnify:CR=1 FL=1